MASCLMLNGCYSSVTTGAKSEPIKSQESTTITTGETGGNNPNFEGAKYTGQSKVIAQQNMRVTRFLNLTDNKLAFSCSDGKSASVIYNEVGTCTSGFASVGSLNLPNTCRNTNQVNGYPNGSSICADQIPKNP